MPTVMAKFIIVLVVVATISVLANFGFLAWIFL